MSLSGGSEPEITQLVSLSVSLLQKSSPSWVEMWVVGLDFEVERDLSVERASLVMRGSPPSKVVLRMSRAEPGCDPIVQACPH